MITVSRQTSQDKLSNAFHRFACIHDRIYADFEMVLTRTSRLSKSSALAAYRT